MNESGDADADNSTLPSSADSSNDIDFDAQNHNSMLIWWKQKQFQLTVMLLPQMEAHLLY